MNSHSPLSPTAARAAIAVLSCLLLLIPAAAAHGSVQAAVSHVRLSVNTAPDCNLTKSGAQSRNCLVSVTQTPAGSANHPGCFYLAGNQNYDDNGLNNPDVHCALSSTTSQESKHKLPLLDPGASKLADSVTVNVHWNTVEPSSPSQNWAAIDDQIGVAVANRKSIVPVLTFQSGYACTQCYDWGSIASTQFVAPPPGSSGVEANLVVRRPFDFPLNIVSASWSANMATIYTGPRAHAPQPGWQTQICGLAGYEPAPDSNGCQMFTIASSGKTASQTWVTYALPLSSDPGPISNAGTAAFQIKPHDKIHSGTWIDTFGSGTAQKGEVQAVTDDGDGSYTIEVNWSWAAAGSQIATANTTMAWGCKGHGNLQAWELDRLRANRANLNAVCDGQWLWIPNYWSHQFITDWQGFVNAAAQHLEHTFDAVAPAPPPTDAPVPSILIKRGHVDAGQHIYAVTFVTAGGESLPGPSSDPIAIPHRGARVRLAGVPTAPDEWDVVARDVYRTKAGTAGPLRFVGTIDDNSTTSFVDNVADGSLGAAAPNSATSPAAGCEKVTSGVCFASLTPSAQQCPRASGCYSPSDIYYARVAAGLNDEGLPFIGYATSGLQLVAWAEADAAGSGPSGCSTRSTSRSITQLTQEWAAWQECMLPFYRDQFTYDNQGTAVNTVVQYPINEASGGVNLHPDLVAEWALKNGLGVGQNGFAPGWGCGTVDPVDPNGCRKFLPQYNRGATTRDVISLGDYLAGSGAAAPVFELQSYNAQTQLCSGLKCHPASTSCASDRAQLQTYLPQAYYPQGGRQRGIGVTTLEVYHTDLDWSVANSSSFYHRWAAGETEPDVFEGRFFHALTCS